MINHLRWMRLKSQWRITSSCTTVQYKGTGGKTPYTDLIIASVHLLKTLLHTLMELQMLHNALIEFHMLYAMQCIVIHI